LLSPAPSGGDPVGALALPGKFASFRIEKRWCPNTASLGRYPKSIMVVTGGCDVLAFENCYAADSVQFPNWCACLERRCTACVGGDGEWCTIMLPPQWQTPLHVGNVGGYRRHATVWRTYYSLPLPLSVPGCQSECSRPIRKYSRSDTHLTLCDSSGTS
jgi:hypothetical protein